MRPVDGNGPYVAIYEIEGDDLQAILDNMIANGGQLHLSDALQLDPPPADSTVSRSPPNTGANP